jgi:uncharacterized membrane protein
MAELVVLASADEATAGRALEELQRLQDEAHALTLRDWALVVREDDDHLAVTRSSEPPRVRGGVAFAGGAMGLIIGGLLFAPLMGLMVGTLLGAALGRREDSGVTPAFAGELSTALESGAAALFLYVIATDADRAIEGLVPFAPRVVRTSLSPEDEATLRSRFERAAGETGAPAPAPEAGEPIGPEGPLHRSFGSWYPTDFVVALADDAAQAEGAAAALEGAGFPRGEIDYHDSEQVLEQVEAFRREEGRAQRAAGQGQERLSSVGQVAQRYREAAQRGDAVVAVRAASPDLVEAAGRVLRAQGAREIYHFGRRTVADLNARP